MGSADGYYAVGAAVASPAMRAWAYDISRSARSMCTELAAENGVGDRVRVGGRFTLASLGDLPHGERALVLVDIEGGEVELLDAEAASVMAGHRVVVEVHEHAVPGAGAALRSAFAATHSCRVIAQAPVGAAEASALESWSAADRDLGLREFRAPADHWIDLVPLGDAQAG